MPGPISREDSWVSWVPSSDVMVPGIAEAFHEWMITSSVAAGSSFASAVPYRRGRSLLGRATTSPPRPCLSLYEAKDSTLRGSQPNALASLRAFSRDLGLFGRPTRPVSQGRPHRFEHASFGRTSRSATRTDCAASSTYPASALDGSGENLHRRQQPLLQHPQNVLDHPWRLLPHQQVQPDRRRSALSDPRHPGFGVLDPKLPTIALLFDPKARVPQRLPICFATLHKTRLLTDRPRYWK